MNDKIIKYTKDGKKVVVLDELGDGQSVVQEMYVTGGVEHPAGDRFVVRNLLDELSKTWKEKHNDELKQVLERQEADLKKKQKRLVGLRNAANARLEAWAANEQHAERYTEVFERARKFLAGEYTHLYLPDFQRPSVISVDEVVVKKEEIWGQNFETKLVSLVGKSNGDLGFRLSRYSDGSGSSKEIFLAESYAGALVMAQEDCDLKAEGYLRGDSGNHFDPKQWQGIEGIVIKQEALDKHAAGLEKARQANIEKKLEELGKLGWSNA